MTNPSGNHQELNQLSYGSSFLNGAAVGGNRINGHSLLAPPPPENPGGNPKLKHNPVLSTEWTYAEQLFLEEGLIKYASESNINRYSKIAMELQSKTVRDVALRCRWMSKKEISKRRTEDHILARRGKDRKERVTGPSANSSQLEAQPGHTQQRVTMGNGHGISHNAIGGPLGKILEQNALVFDQISANMSTNQIHGNISLFCQAWENILQILRVTSYGLENAMEMPEFPVNIDGELFNSFLSLSAFQMQP